MLRQGIFWGIGLGICTVIIYLLAYLISPAYFLSSIVYWATWIMYLLVIYRLSQKAVEQGVVTFQGIIRPLFVTYLVANAIYYIFYYVMVYEVDANLLQIQQQQMVQGLAELNIESTDLQAFTWKNYFFTYIQSAIGGFIVAASIAYSQKHD